MKNKIIEILREHDQTFVFTDSRGNNHPFQGINPNRYDELATRIMEQLGECYVKVKCEDELPKEREKYYHTSRGYLFFNQCGFFCDEDLFPIETMDKIKWWLKKLPPHPKEERPIIEQIVLKVLDGMVGIGGIPGNDEFCDEFDMRLRAALDVYQPKEEAKPKLSEGGKHEILRRLIKLYSDAGYKDSKIRANRLFEYLKEYFISTPNEEDEFGHVDSTNAKPDILPKGKPDWNKLREQYFDECVNVYDHPSVMGGLKRVSMAPHDLFEWFKKRLSNPLKEEPKDSAEGWISVEDRLPEQEGDYLCVRFSGQFVATYKRLRNRRDGSLFKTKQWEPNGVFVGRAGEGVTVDSWMPLPDPPTVESKKD